MFRVETGLFDPPGSVRGPVGPDVSGGDFTPVTSPEDTSPTPTPAPRRRQYCQVLVPEFYTHNVCSSESPDMCPVRSDRHTDRTLRLREVRVPETLLPSPWSNPLYLIVPSLQAYVVSTGLCTRVTPSVCQGKTRIFTFWPPSPSSLSTCRYVTISHPDSHPASDDL